MAKLSTPSVATLLVPPVSGGQLLAQCSVTDSTPRIGVVPRRGEGVDKNTMTSDERIRLFINKIYQLTPNNLHKLN